LSLSQAEIKSLRALTTKKGRRATGQFLAEGVRVLEQALQHDFLPGRLYVSASTVSERGTALAEQFKRRGVPVIPASGSDLARVGDTVTPPGLLGVFQSPPDELAELYGRGPRSMVLCDSIADPGNLGTLIRSAAAFDFDLVVLAGQCAEAFAPKVVRASAGASFAVPIAVAPLAEVLTLIERERVHLVAADPRGEDLPDAIANDADGGVALALGSEAHGLSPALLQRADARVRVRHEARVESLNAAIAGSILMKEWYDVRQRRTP